MTIPADPHDLDALVREAVDVLDEGISIYDADMKVLFADATTLQRFRQVYADLAAGVPWRETNKAAVRRIAPALTEEQVDATAQELGDRLLRGETVDMPSETGGYVRVHYRRMSGGRIAAVSTDITDLRARERELKIATKTAKAASEAKSAFLANVSHEIRTPLNGMLGMAQLLAGSNLSESQREQVDAIVDSGKTLVALLNDVLDLSKIEAGKMVISPVATDFIHILRRLYKLWAPNAEEKGLELTLDIAASLPSRLTLDPVRVRQCISNLISNAIKFTSAGEVNVHVSIPKTGPNAGLVQVKVRDSGIGMDAETIDRLFTPFTQGDNSTTRRFGGTGLGLSITKVLAEMMGGGVSVKSEPGEGSTFVLTFRAEAAAQAVDPVPANDIVVRNAPMAPDLSILVVDDVALNRKVARLFLEQRGWTITEASHGSEALDKLQASPFDVVLLDVHMPVMDGPETLQRLRTSGAAYADIPVIALTANAMSDDRERYLKMGMDGYVAKPIDQRELFSEIERVRAHERLLKAC